MNGEKVIIVANDTRQGLSVIDIQFYNISGRISGPPPHRLIRNINALPLRDKERVRMIVARSYGLPAKNVVFQ